MASTLKFDAARNGTQVAMDRTSFMMGLLHAIRVPSSLATLIAAVGAGEWQCYGDQHPLAGDGGVQNTMLKICFAPSNSKCTPLPKRPPGRRQSSNVRVPA